MVERVYLKEPYLKELTAKITSINSNKIELDRTLFYPAGGGIPCDNGTIKINGAEYKVIDASKETERIIHTLDLEPVAKIGDIVHCKLDWDRRYACMRYHTATHVIDGITTNRYNGRLTGGMIYPDRAHDDFDMPNLNKELAQKILDEAQVVIDEGHNVSARIISKEEASKMSNLVRTAPGEEIFKEQEQIRVIDIEGFDMQFDGGLHVSNTKEVGKLELVKFENKGMHRKRIEIKLK